MTTVTLLNVNAARTLEIVHELRQNLRQHADFDYKFIPGGYTLRDPFGYQPPGAEFTFYNPPDATAFSLKYQ